MLDPSRFQSPAAAPPRQAGAKPPQQYYTTHNDRMAGSVPTWGAPKAGQSPATTALSPTENPGTPGLGIAAQEPPAAATDAEPFGFFDLLDMVNPLQHVPVVNSVYRNVTGDEIKPISRIIGGTIFGGPVGGASGLANVIVEYETGRDVAGNVVALVRNGEAPQWRSRPDDPARRLDQAVRLAAAEAENPSTAAHDSTVPDQALSFVDTKPARPAPQYYDDNDRMAGSIPRYGERHAAPVVTPPRDPIMTLDMTPLPLIQDERFAQN